MQAAEGLLIRSFGTAFRNLVVGDTAVAGLPGPFAALFRHLVPTPPVTPRDTSRGDSLGFETRGPPVPWGIGAGSSGDIDHAEGDSRSVSGGRWLTGAGGLSVEPSRGAGAAGTSELRRGRLVALTQRRGPSPRHVPVLTSVVAVDDVAVISRVPH